MEQIIETIQISKFDTTGDSSKQNLIDKKYTLDDPVFENYGKMKIPCGDQNEFFELKNVNFVYLMSECPFNLLINNLVIISTRHFSFINPNKTITVSIATNADYDLSIEYCYGLLKCGEQDDAIKAASSSMGVKWDRVLKNIFFEADEEGNLPTTIDDSQFRHNQKFANYEVPNVASVSQDQLQDDSDTWHTCTCHNRSNTQNLNTFDSAVQKVQRVQDVTTSSDGRVRYISLDRI